MSTTTFEVTLWHTPPPHAPSPSASSPSSWYRCSHRHGGNKTYLLIVFSLITLEFLFKTHLPYLVQPFINLPWRTIAIGCILLFQTQRKKRIFPLQGGGKDALVIGIDRDGNTVWRQIYRQLVGVDSDNRMRAVTLEMANF